MKQRIRWVGLAPVVLALTVGIVAACGRSGDLDLGGGPALKLLSEVTKDKTRAVGKKVQLTDVTATRAVGDYVFWVQDGGEQLPVVLEKEVSGAGEEGAVQIQRGRRYNIDGTVRLVENVPETSRMWRLMKKPSIDEVRRAVVYIGADNVTER